MMNRNSEQHQSIRKLYGADKWVMGRRSQAETGVRKSVLVAEKSPLPLIKRTPLSGGGYIDVYGDSKDVFVTVWVYDCGTPAGAHDEMVDFLLNCTAPRLPEAAERGLQTGNVSFAGVDDPPTSMTFVRDHWFVRIHSTGSTRYPIKQIAKFFDELLAVKD